MSHEVFDWNDLPSSGSALVAIFHGIGDNILATSAIRKIHDRRPDLKLVIAVREDNGTADIWRTNPCVSDVVELPVRPKYFLPTYRFFEERPLERLLANTGSRLQVDKVVHLRVTRLPGFTNKLLRYPHKSIMMARELNVDERNLIPEIFPQEKHREEVARFLIASGSDGRPVVAVNRMSSEARKHWSIDEFERACAALAAKGYFVVQFYTPSSLEFENEAAGRNAGSVAGVVSSVDLMRAHPSVLTAAALFEASDAVVSVDSGPMHLASAVGTPTVGVFPATEPALYGPIHVSSKSIRGQANSNEVLDAVTGLLAKGSSK